MILLSRRHHFLESHLIFSLAFISLQPPSTSPRPRNRAIAIVQPRSRSFQKHIFSRFNPPDLKMQREGYVPPSAGGSGGASRGGGGYSDVPRQTSMRYLCADCGKAVTLNKGDPIRCKECGFRILYKERTKRMVQFEAR